MKKVLSVFLAVIMLISVFSASFGVFAEDAKNGFVRENGAVYYYKDGVMQKERWISWNDNLYYVKEDGKVAANELLWIEKNSSYYYFNPKGIMQKDGLVKHYYTAQTDEGAVYKTDTYFAQANGRLFRGWKTINDNKYYFGPEKYKDGIKTINNYPFFFGHNGVLKTGFIKYTFKSGMSNSTITKYYYANAKGVLVRGWQTIDGKKYYFENDINNPEMYKNGACEIGENRFYVFAKNGVLLTGEGWKTVDGIRYYTNKNGAAYRGIKKIDGKTYCLDPGMVTGAYDVSDSPSKFYIFGKDGVRVTKPGWVRFADTVTYGDGSKEKGYFNYYVGNDGLAKTEWQKIGGKTYYFWFLGANMFRNCGREIYKYNTDGSIKSIYVYVFEKDGSLTTKTGWLTLTSDDGKTENRYYIRKNGIAKTGWTKIGNYYYYFDKFHGQMAKGVTAIKNEKTDVKKIYFFNSNGTWVKNKAGWVKDGDDRYYFVKGVAKTGWTKIGDYYYHFGDDGRMDKGVASVWVESNTPESREIFYFFNDNGTWVKDKSGFVKAVSKNWDGNDETFFYYYVNGRAIRGWKTIGGKIYYFDDYCRMCRNGIYNINGEMHYFNEKGVLVR